MTPDTIKQRTIAVPLSTGASAIVRRMPWKFHKDLLKTIPREIKRLDLFALDQLTVAQLVEKLPEIIAASEALIDHLITHATNVPVDQAETELDALDIGNLVGAAVSLHFDADLKNSWAGIAQALTSMFRTGGEAGDMPTETTPGSTSTPASSMPATPPTT